MIGIRFKGRLGNQLFQYSFVRGISRKLGFSFFISYPIDENVLLQKYFNLGNPYRLLMAQAAGKLIGMLGLKYKTVQIKETDKQPGLEGIADSVIYDGYFQTSYYYDKCKDLLKEELSVRRKFKKDFQKKFGITFNENKTLVIHFRRSDYERFFIPDLNDVDFRLPTSYYQNCVQQVENIFEYKIFVIGDWEDANLSFLEENKNVVFTTNEMIVDFQLLQNADVLIISNSSFAWWGAMLNLKQEKRVFAPKFWIGFKQKREYPRGIMSPDWEWIDVNENVK